MPTIVTIAEMTVVPPKPKPTLSSWSVEGVRKQAIGKRSNAVEYGVIETTIAKRKTFCRACGKDIKKGEKRLTFYWDYNGCGSWTAVESHMHFDDCTGVMSAQ